MKQDDIEKALRAISLTMTAAQAGMDFVRILHANGHVTDERFAEVKGEYDAIGKSWDDRVAEANQRLGNG